MKVVVLMFPLECRTLFREAARDAGRILVGVPVEVRFWPPRYVSRIWWLIHNITGCPRADLIIVPSRCVSYGKWNGQAVVPFSLVGNYEATKKEITRLLVGHASQFVVNDFLGK